MMLDRSKITSRLEAGGVVGTEMEFLNMKKYFNIFSIIEARIFIYGL